MFGTCEFLNNAVKPCTSYVRGGYCSRPDMFRCIEYIKQTEPPMSYSSIRDYTHCHRKFYLGWIQGLELIEKSRAIVLGSKADHILGILHSVKDQETAIDRYQSFINAEIEKTIDTEDSESVGDLQLWTLKAMFDAYTQLGRHNLKGIAQYEFRWNGLGYPKIHGFLDLARPEDHMGYEFKYTTNADYYEKFSMTDQLSSYLIGAPTIQQFTVICFVPPFMKFKKGEKITELYERTRANITRGYTQHFISKNFWRSEFDLDAYRNKAQMVCREIMGYITADYADPKYPFYQNFDGCHQPFGCDFIDICRSGVMPENLYKKREVRRFS